MGKNLRIALLVDWSYTYERELLRGVAAHARVHGPWSFFHQAQMLGRQTAARLRQWGAQGLIVRSQRPEVVALVRELDVPAIDLLGWEPMEGVPVFDVDHRAVVRLAIDELLHCGFRHFGYCGFSGLYYSDQRAAMFVSELEQRGYEASVFPCPRSRPTTNRVMFEAKGALHAGRIAQWIRSLPKPVGVMACSDVRGQQVLSACGQYGLTVPEEVAVVASGNDPTVCELGYPALSSVDTNTRELGLAAAGLLQRMIEGEPPPVGKTLGQPKGVVTRHSTDVVAVADPDVAAALSFIRQNAREGIDVEDVLAHVQVSRSTLDRRFARLLGRSAKAEIVRVRLEHVKQLLRETDYPLAKIAELTGFKHVEYLCNTFKQKTGRTAGEYRGEGEEEA